MNLTEVAAHFYSQWRKVCMRRGLTGAIMEWPELTQKDKDEIVETCRSMLLVLDIRLEGQDQNRIEALVRLCREAIVAPPTPESRKTFEHRLETLLRG